MIILDNVLSSEDLETIKNNSGEYDSEFRGLYQWNILKIFHPLIKTAAKYYSLHNCIGYEIWEQNNGRPPKWHYDRDEILAKQGILSFPICTLVFYIEVDNLTNGNLLIENGIQIKPITNRLVIFGPKVKHYVEEFSGTRHSLIINPWNKFLGEYPVSE